MNSHPMFTTQIKFPEENYVSSLFLHKEAMLKDIQRGVEKAAKNLGPQITEWAQTACEARVKKEVEHYFMYGEGSRMIQETVQKGLADLFKVKGNKNNGK
jgi:hypothetical protein